MHYHRVLCIGDAYARLHMLNLHANFIVVYTLLFVNDFFFASSSLLLSSFFCVEDTLHESLNADTFGRITSI